jgi:UDP-N-acetylglucosamine--dolichyl-phosphate N-acetylglucosaminephosphotransferase
MIEIIISIIVSAIVTFFITPYAIKYFRFIELTTTDVHKKNKPLVPNSAGVPVVSGIMAGLLVYIFLSVFIHKQNSQLVSLFASMTSILIVMFSGFIDDLNTKQVKVAGYIEGKRGLKAWQKPLLTLPAAFPLMAIMAGNTTMSLPLIGSVNFGIFYPLVIIPIGVVGASNMINMLGGYNFLEGGMGLIYTFSLGLFAYLHGSLIASIIFLTTFGALCAIAKYNFYPAKILPGDSLTYTLGAVVATGAIIGNMEKATIITMLPFIIQGVLKFYSRFKLGHFASDLGILQKDGSIKPKYGKQIYSWIHLITNLRNLTERQIVFVMMAIQAVFSIIPFLGIL